MTRRGLLAGLGLVLATADSMAQDAPGAASPGQPAPPPPAAAPQASAPRRPRPRRRTARRTAPETAPATDPQASGMHLDPAPVPNRTVEGPRIPTPAQNPSFGPSIIHRPLPNTSSARDGARNYDEERLFFPAPGARLTVPFSY